MKQDLGHLLLKMAVAVGIAATAAAPTASAGPLGVFGGCPGSLFAGFADRPAASTRRPCVVPLEPGRRRAAAQACGVLLGNGSAAPPPSRELSHRLRRDPDSKKWKILELRQGHRTVVRWSSAAGIDCVSGIYLSADRRTVAVQVVRSKMTLMTTDDPRQLVVFHLKRPLPRGAPPSSRPVGQ